MSAVGRWARGEVDLPESPHPAKFSMEILNAIDHVITEEAERVGRRLRIVDPCAGVGRVHRLGEAAHRTVAGDLEPEWVQQAAPLGPSVVADARRLPYRDDTFDVFVTSYCYGNRMCFPAGTLVCCERGHMPIEQIVEGDMVLTHTGRFQAVKWAGPTGMKPMVEMIGQGPGRLRCTADHPILARRRIGATNLPVRLTAAAWEPASTLERSYWAVPALAAVEGAKVPAIPTVVRDEEAWWFVLGWWLADGTWSRQPRGTKWQRATVVWSRGTGVRDELCAERLAAAFGGRATETSRTGLSVRQWALYSNEVIEWLITHVGKLAHGKNLPGWTLGLIETYRRALLTGWLAGDGCEMDRDGRAYQVGTSVSRPLIRGLQLLAHSIGLSTGVNQMKRAGVEMIMGRLSPVRDAWTLRITTPTRRTHRLPDGDWYQVRSVQPVEPAMGYDIEVADDHSFIAEAIIVHNSDHHEARDACTHTVRRKGGEAKVYALADCPKCKGSGLSERNTYRHKLGRMPSRGSTAVLPFGPGYRLLHQGFYTEGLRIVRGAGLLVVNVSNFLRTTGPVGGRREVEERVVEWHTNEMMAMGCNIVEVRRVATRRNRNGANGDRRVEGERVIVMRTPAKVAGTLLSSENTGPYRATEPVPVGGYL